MFMNVLGDPLIDQALALFLALLFGGAGLHKWRTPAAFAEILRHYDLLPARLLPLATRVIPLAELLLVVSLLIPGARSIALFASAMLLALYAGAIAQALARGRWLEDCGCGWGRQGPTGTQAAQAGWVWRNVALASLTLLVAALETPVLRVPGWLDLFTVLVGAALAALLYALGNQLLVNHYRHREIFHD